MNPTRSLVHEHPAALARTESATACCSNWAPAAEPSRWSAYRSAASPPRCPAWLVRESAFRALTCGFARPTEQSNGGSTFETGGTPHLAAQSALRAGPSPLRRAWIRCPTCRNSGVVKGSSDDRVARCARGVGLRHHARTESSTHHPATNLYVHDSLVTVGIEHQLHVCTLDPYCFMSPTV